MLSRNTRDALLAVLILVIPVALWWLVDEDLLQKLAFGVIALGVASVFAVRKYLDRLDQAMQALPESAPGGQPFGPSSLPLKPFERQLLGILDLAHPERIRRKLASRRALLVSIAMGPALCALIALIALILIHAD